MSNSKPLISVVIPTYNRSYIIEQAIRSVLNQSYNNLELLVVDDASTDNTEEIVKNIKDERIRYIKLSENSKGRKPRNVGINQSNGKYIAFLDSDDTWLPTKLEKQLEFIQGVENNGKEVMSFTGLIIKNRNKKIYKRNKPYNNENIMEYVLVGRNEVQTSTYMIPSSIAKRTLFDENLKKHQDWDFCLRLMEKEVSFYCLHECLTIWNVDYSNNRISNSYKNELVSTEWLNSKKSQLTLKAQLAFKAIILMDNFIERQEFGRAFKVAFTAFFYRSIGFGLLLKTLAKICIPKKYLNSLRN